MAPPVKTPFVSLISAPFGSGNALKSAAALALLAVRRVVSDGTITLIAGCGCKNRCSSNEKKKKVLSLLFQKDGPPSPNRGKTRGPPNVPPKLLKRSGGFLASKKSRASNTLLRTNSNSVP